MLVDRYLSITCKLYRDASIGVISKTPLTNMPGDGGEQEDADPPVSSGGGEEQQKQEGDEQQQQQKQAAEGEQDQDEREEVRRSGETQETMGSFERGASQISQQLLLETGEGSAGGGGGVGGTPLNRRTTTGWKHNSQMPAAKDERKRAEYDVQLLANRLAFLRTEERAAKKRIKDTKSRTRQVMEAKVAAKRQDDVSLS